MHAILTDALEIVEAEWEVLSTAPDGADFALQALQFLTVMRRDPTISVILEELREDERASAAAFDDAEARVRTGVSSLCSRLPAPAAPTVDAMPAAAAVPSAADDRDWPDLLSRTPREQIAARAAAAADPTEAGDEPRDSSNAREMVNLMGAIIRDDKLGGTVGEEFEELRTDLDHAWRVRRLASKQSGAAALARLERMAFVLDPDRASLRGEHGLLRWIVERSSPGEGGIYELVYKRQRGGREVPLGNVLVDRRRDAGLLHAELRRRLRGRRSLLLPLMRFKERAEWYDADRLRTLYEANTKTGEDTLTGQLALYLYDLGLRPFLRPMMGRLMPDIVNLEHWHLYVESKLYLGRSYVLRGAYQAWDTIGRIRGEGFPLREAFLVIFRLKGPRLVMPSSVRAGGVTMYPIVVDLAPGKVSGRGQRKQPVEIAEADLSPRPAEAYPPGGPDDWWTEPAAEEPPDIDGE